ncbi:prophage LambdaCh01, tail tape measure protein [Carboxydothermus hydrogenoformans]|uniref:Putative prophage LambdaCh01, tail tape measure protein n=1 Tax=Carboxydothermus hydrogenoformans (strain ATCC BAA-161 / DSM 6008 / Z-2901) TaxID=246194 RepID=Q3ABK2_CARHZ|nr:prophage LambdaCh01, tail tape measure protein [Carboxydothermus hydrogenoformans]ABB15686.1 putative prophage LambdaCh01, tail tape measure protein [Carboxydothermus hydrogenoformans Z-2901]
MEVGRLFVLMGVDMSNLIRSLKEAELRVKDFADETKKQFKDLGENIQKVGEKMSLAITAPLTFIGRQMVNTAMDAIESENLFEVSFGNMADAARKWSEETAKALGISAYSLRQNAGMFFTMFKSMGFSNDAALRMSESLTQLSYDMASFYNLKPEEAFEKLRAGITGETEPLKALGILVDEETAKQYAYQTGIAKTGEELSQTQKVIARYGLILKQTAAAQGDLARTAESPANQARKLREQWRDLSVTIGSILLPVITRMIDLLSKAIYIYQQLPRPLQVVTVAFTVLIAAVGPLLTVFGALVTILPQLTAGFAALSTVLARNPIVAIVMALAAAFGMYWINAQLAKKANEDMAKTNPNEIYKKYTDIFKEATKATANTTKEIKKFLAAFDEVYNVIEETEQANLGSAVENLLPEWDITTPTTPTEGTGENESPLKPPPIVPPARNQQPPWGATPQPAEETAGTWERVRNRISEIWEELQRRWEEVKSRLQWPIPAPALAPEWQTKLQNVWEGIKRGWETVKNGIVVGVPSLVTGIATNLATLPGRLQTTWNTVKTSASTVWGNIKEKFREIISGIPGLAQTYATQIGQKLEPVKTKAQQVWNTTKEKFREIISSIPSLAQTYATQIGQKFEPLKATVRSVWENIKTNFNTIIGSLPGLAQGIATKVGNFLSGIWEKVKGLKTELSALAGGGLAALLAALGKRILPNIPIPAYASGGIVTTPQVALVGEKEPEAIIPLSKLDALLSSIQGEQTVINLNIGTLVADEAGLRELERRLARVRIDEQRRVVMSGI